MLARPALREQVDPVAGAFAQALLPPDEVGGTVEAEVVTLVRILPAPDPRRMQDSAKVLERLKQLAKLPANREIKGIDIDPPAAALVQDLDAHPHAFVLGCVADRQVPADRAWELPWRLSQRVGGFRNRETAKSFAR